MNADLTIKPDSFNRIRIDYIRNLGSDTGRIVLSLYGKASDDRLEVAIKLPLYHNSLPEDIIDAIEKAISAAKVDIINYRTKSEASLLQEFGVTLDKGGAE